MSNTYNIPKKNIELNERIAREVMGWRQHDEYKHLWYTQDSMKPAQVLPDFSGDMNDAWLVFERMGPCWVISQAETPMAYSDDERWWCWLPVEYGGTEEEPVMARTAPLAICLAALKTVAK